uniref:Amino acid permease/ SLC12A domain-containing protein n=1 Tax=Anopheles maculatus TaxID=74869 RepID=A0A182S912_9DIPT
MAVVAGVTTTFIIIGDINTLAPIVTMPFLLTYACIDYSYFALAQTFDIQNNREERFRIQAQSPLYETRNYGATGDYNENNDLDQLFPERTRHKNLGTPTNSPQHVPSTAATSARSQQPNGIPHSASVTSADSEVVFRDGTNSANNANSLSEADDEPIAPIRPPIHSKTKNWYSGFCNRWASLLGAGVKILVMMLVSWVYALICIGTVFIVWFYVGTANPAVKPGLAHEFRFFVWLKNVVFRCFGKRVHDYEQVVVTQTCPNVNLASAQLNEENEDFASRRRYHQTAVVQGRYVDEV